MKPVAKNKTIENRTTRGNDQNKDVIDKGKTSINNIFNQSSLITPMAGNCKRRRAVTT
ncbi:hypothetical protein M153_7720002776 [Pseudoloma neurophilia]|uniref:Uncharacterized protein n=1 Tax=Pseudoloma neurophilia TaxID=146866 RepID=A0A0R0LW27_9MICR|nr:hypothetical protein M153_7720002776 [Pseudoloma neurophilia]